MRWFIVGISGVSGGGKTTLATKLENYFNERLKTDSFIGNVRVERVLTINQDKFFYPRDSPKHTWINDINFINREILSAIDMQTMWENIEIVLRKKDGKTGIATTTTPADDGDDNESIGILLIEGFLIFNDDRINDLCRLRFHMTLTRAICMERRMKRQSQWKHVNPNPVKYFNEYVWPMYLKYRSMVKRSDDIHYLNGEIPKDDLFNDALKMIEKNLFESLEQIECKKLT